MKVKDLFGCSKNRKFIAEGTVDKSKSWLKQNRKTHKQYKKDNGPINNSKNQLNSEIIYNFYYFPNAHYVLV